MPRRQKKVKDAYEKDFVDDEPVDDEVDDEPPSIDPYEVLGLEKEATADDVKKAYRKAALKWHPDKASESDKSAANKKFQEIAFAYAVLSDDRRRKRYDLTGSTAETLEDDEDFDWLSFYREQFEDVVTQDNIQRIHHEYKGSMEEKKDLLNAYTKGKGNLDKVYAAVMLSDILEDDDRFRQVIDKAIEKGEVESWPAYERENDTTRQRAKETERKRRADFDKRHGPDAADKAKAKQKAKKGNGPGDLGDLAALIQQRQKSRMGGFFDKLEAKYAPKSQSRKRATPMEDEPTEEEFLAARKRVNNGKGKGKAKERGKKIVESEDEDEEMDDEDIEESGEDWESEEEAPKKKKGKVTKGKGRAKTKA